MMTTAEPVIPSPGLTREEIERAVHYLRETRDGLVEAAAGLSETQWTFKPAPGSWSIAEIVEHVTLIERMIAVLIGKMAEAPEVSGDSRVAEMDEFIVREIPKRTRKVKAPPHTEPRHGWSGPEAVEHFVESREQTGRLLSGPQLRGRVVPHPIFGPLDGYQWILGTASHSARHTAQIAEVKSASDFPV